MADRYSLDAGVTEVDAWLPGSPGLAVQVHPGLTALRRSD